MENTLKILLGLLGGMTIVQLAPIKIDPWSWLARKIGRAINGEVIAKMNTLEINFNNLSHRMDERAAKDARIRILRFGDELLHGVQHSKEHFDQILLDITEYEQYCRDHPEFKNNMTKLTTQHIQETYLQLFEERAFT